MNNLKFVAVLLLTFLFLLNTGTAKETVHELSVEELKAVAQSIRAVEDALLNVRIDSNAWVEHGPSSSGPWERTPVCLSSTTYFGNTSSSQARLDIHKIVLEWKDGAAPYLEESYSISFDGVQGRRRAISSSYSGKTFDRDRGFILPEAPIELKSSWYDKMTGVRASLFFHYRGMPEPFPKRFSTGFEAAADPNSYLSALAAADPKYLNVKPLEHKVVFEELGGIQCIKAACIPDDSFRQEWWFDPSRGFALLRFDDLRKDQDGNEQLKSSINVTKLEEVAENIWWPMEAYFVQCPRETDKPWKRIVYRASKVIANDPNFDESIFTVPFPDGYLIDDQVAGRKYRVGEK
ncbi:hypothetical protein ES703_84335 [subsurface metagenome]